MLDLFYNGVLLLLIMFWLLSMSNWRSGRLISILKARSNAIAAVLWAIFLVFAFAYCLYFDELGQRHDIPNAVDAAVISQGNDLNPYNHSVIPRFDSRYSSAVSVVYGPYNYLPFDLNVYSVFQALIGFLGMPLWFVITNIVFSSAAFVLLRELLGVRWRSYAPLAGIVILFYSFDNVTLTLLLVVASMFLYRKSNMNYRALAIIVMGLAMMTKIHAVIPFGVLVLYEFERAVRSRDIDVLLRAYASVTTSAAIAAVLMLPFGIGNVVRSAVLFHGDAVARTGTSSGGTMLMELSLTNTEYTYLVIAFMLLAIAVSLRFRSLNDRMMIVSIVFLLVAVKSSQALLIIPGIFLPLKLREISKLKPVQSRSIVAVVAPLRRRLGWRA